MIEVSHAISIVLAYLPGYVVTRDTNRIHLIITISKQSSLSRLLTKS